MLEQQHKGFIPDQRCVSYGCTRPCHESLLVAEIQNTGVDGK